MNVSDINNDYIELDICPQGNITEYIIKYAATLCQEHKYSLKSLYKNIKGDYEVKYNIPFGITEIFYENTKFVLEYTRNLDNVVGTSHAALYPITLNIKCYGDKSILDSFIISSKKYAEPKKEDKIICKVLKSRYWSLLSKFDKRNIDSIFLKKDDKENIIKDLKNFLDSKESYSKFGIPYKRNYLLYGIPGTGKSSLITSLASLFNMNISIINFDPNITDTVFMNAVNTIDKNNILILEDIDSLFTKRHISVQNKSCVTFSGILNVLDGIVRKNNLVTFITTNYIDKLDDALIRPGRIDYKLKFDYSTKYQIKNMYKFFFPNKKNFKTFYDKIKRYNLTTSTLQKFYFENLNNDNILDKIGDLINLSKLHNPEHNMYV